MSVDLTQDQKLGMLYPAIFDRMADNDGYHFWKNELEQGATVDDVARTFFDSDEGQDHFGGMTSDEIVQHAYQHSFSRSAGQSAEDFWSNKIDNGEHPGEVIKSINESAEGYDSKMVEAKALTSGSYGDANFGSNDLQYADNLDEAMETMLTEMRASGNFSFQRSSQHDMSVTGNNGSGVDYTWEAHTDSNEGSIIADNGVTTDSMIWSEDNQQHSSDLDDGLLVA